MSILLCASNLDVNCRRLLAGPGGGGTGFRAYVAAKDNPRKRPPEPVVKEEGGRSSGSDRTDKLEAKVRRPLQSFACSPSADSTQRILITCQLLCHSSQTGVIFTHH